MGRWGVVAAALAINFVTLPGQLMGAASVEYVKQTVLLFGIVCYLLNMRRWRLYLGVAAVPVATFAFFAFYCTATLLWSESVADSLRYINKVWLAVALVGMILSSRVRDYLRILRTLDWVMVGFLFLTVLSEVLFRDFLYPQRIGDNRLVGFSDVHSTKYLASIAGVVFFVRALTTRRARWAALAGASFLITALSLQRAIIAAVIGALALELLLLYLRTRRVKVAVGSCVMLVATAVGGFYLLFEYPPLRARMFPTELHAAMAEELILSGRPMDAYQLVQTHGRDEFWAIAKTVDRGVGGIGFGVAATQIERAIGSYWQMHNDYLKLLVETGPAGVALYALLIIAVLSSVLIGVTRARTQLGATLFMIAGGCFIIAPLNGIFDNALDHVQKNVFFGLAFLIMAARWEHDSAGVGDEAPALRAGAPLERVV